MVNCQKSIFNPRYRRLVGEIVKIRKEHGLTQRDLAKLTGKTNCFIGRVETCERRLNIIEAVDILKTLGIADKGIMRIVKTLL